MELTDRQLEIMDAACRRIDEYGIQELTTKNLAADLGVSEAALYRHFKSKNDILEAVLDLFFHSLKREIKNVLDAAMPHNQRICRFMLVPFTLFKQNPAIVGVIFSDGIFQFDQALRMRIQNIIQFNQQTLLGILRAGQESGEIRTDMSPFELAPMVMGTMRFTVLKWKLEKHSYDLLTEGVKACESVEKVIRPPFNPAPETSLN